MGWVKGKEESAGGRRHRRRRRVRECFNQEQETIHLLHPFNNPSNKPSRLLVLLLLLLLFWYLSKRVKTHTATVAAAAAAAATRRYPSLSPTRNRTLISGVRAERDAATAVASDNDSLH